MTPLTYNNKNKKKKKLKQVKKAWKSFKNMVKSKFRDLEIATSIRDSTSRVIRFLSRRLTFPFRTRYIETTSNSNKFQSRNLRSRSIDLFTMRDYPKERLNRRQNDNNYTQIHQFESKSEVENVNGYHRGKEKEEEEEEMPEIADSMEDAWRRVVAASPHLRVNERADEFIYKFRESMRMEKERSFLEFQERLKQSC